VAAVRVQSVSNSSTTTSIAVTATQGWAAPTVGNLIVAWYGGDNTVTTPSGYTAGPSVVDNNAVYFWWKIATAGDSAGVTFTQSGATAGTAGLIEYSGVVTSSPQETAGPTPTFNVTGSAGTSAGPLSQNGTNADGDLFVAMANAHAWSTASAPTSPSWTNSFANFVTQTAASSNPTQNTSFVADFQNTSAASASTTVSFTNASTERSALIIAFKLAAAGGTVSGGRLAPFARSLPPTTPYGLGLPAFVVPSFNSGAAVAGGGTGPDHRASTGGLNETATTTSVATSFPAGTTTGDLVVIIVNVASGSSVFNAVTGWTLDDNHQNFINSNLTTGVYHRVIQAGDTAPTITWTGAGKLAWSAFTVMPTGGGTLAVDAQATPNYQGSSTTLAPTAGAATATVNNDLSLIVMGARNVGNGATPVTTTAPTNWTKPASAENTTTVGTTAALRQVGTTGYYRTQRPTGSVAPGAAAITSGDASYSIYQFLISETAGGGGTTPVSDTDTASAVDAVSDLSVDEASTDTATATDAVSAREAVTTETSTATDAASLTVFLTDSDSATATDAASSLATNLTSSDTASATDAADGRSVTSADAATATDAAALVANLTATDTATVTDAVTSLAQVTLVTDSDTVTAVDAASLTVFLTASDSATATDAITDRSLTSVETATGTDAVSAKSSTSSDTATATDTATTLAVSLTDADTASATDASTNRSLTSTETATVTDAASLVVNLTAADTVSSTETAPTRSLADADAATATDISTNRSLTSSDTASAADAVTSFTGGNFFSSTDTATAVDAVSSLVVNVTSSDSATAADASTPSASLASSDTATSTDAVSARSLNSRDTATATDAVSTITVFLTSAEAATAVDAFLDLTVVTRVSPPKSFTWVPVTHHLGCVVGGATITGVQIAHVFTAKGTKSLTSKPSSGSVTII
jgi:hypothetical protein